MLPTLCVDAAFSRSIIMLPTLCVEYYYLAIHSRPIISKQLRVAAIRFILQQEYNYYIAGREPYARHCSCAAH